MPFGSSYSAEQLEELALGPKYYREARANAWRELMRSPRQEPACAVYCKIFSAATERRLKELLEMDEPAPILIAKPKKTNGENE